MLPLSPNVAVPVNQAFFYLNPFCFWLGYHATVLKIQISYAPRHCKSTIHVWLSQTVPGNKATRLPDPVQRHKRESKCELLIQTELLIPPSVSCSSCHSLLMQDGVLRTWAERLRFVFCCLKGSTEGMRRLCPDLRTTVCSSGLGFQLALLDKSLNCVVMARYPVLAMLILLLWQFLFA